jgi:hypothetical protein
MYVSWSRYSPPFTEFEDSLPSTEYPQLDILLKNLNPVHYLAKFFGGEWEVGKSLQF